MKNTLYFNADFTCDLLENEEATANSIYIQIDADSTQNQTLEIVVGGTTYTVSITSGQTNTVELTELYWASAGDTTIRLNKDGTATDWITLTFPATIDTDASLYQNESETDHYTMQGSWDVKQAVEDLQESDQEQWDAINEIQLKAIDYILPVLTKTDAIADGDTSAVLIFAFQCGATISKAPLIICLNFDAETTVDTDASPTEYMDCEVLITYDLDGTTVATQTQTYGDGEQTLTMSMMFTDLSQGKHILTVSISPTGGSIS